MNLQPIWSTAISLVFLLVGGIAVYIMLAVQGRRDAPDYSRYVRWHRRAGWLFVILFLGMFIFMVARIQNYWEESSARIALHVVLSMALFLLLVLKAAIPRFFPNLLKHMFPLGVSVYLAAFTLVWITAGYFLVWKYQGVPYLYHGEYPSHLLEEDIGKLLFIDKCSTCHLLENIMQARSAQSWEDVVSRMVELAAPRIRPGEGAQILHYLSRTHIPEPRPQGTVLERFCLPCHSRPSEILVGDHSRNEWLEIVLEMREYGPEIIPADQVEGIVDFLVQDKE